MRVFPVALAPRVDHELQDSPMVVPVLALLRVPERVEILVVAPDLRDRLVLRPIRISQSVLVSRIVLEVRVIQERTHARR